MTVSSTAGASPKLSRIETLDGLRGIAIALVLWHHLVELVLPLGHEHWQAWLRAGTGLGWSGVDLFFVLSGFLIGGILIDNRNSPTLVPVFFLRRAARILPLYFATLVALGALVTLWPTSVGLAHPWWVHATFLSNFAFAQANAWDWAGVSVFWSLAVEEQFYLAAPWLIRATSSRMLPWALVAIIIGAQLARGLLYMIAPELTIAQRVLMPLRGDALAWGMLIAWAIRDPRASEAIAFVRAHGVRLLGLAVGGLLLLNLGRPVQGSIFLVSAGYSLISIAYAIVVVVAVVAPPELYRRALSLGPLQQLGKYSYALYLWHSAAFWFITRAFIGENYQLDSWPALALVLATLVLIWTLAMVSWRFFEQPLIRRAHRVSYAPSVTPPT